jgi:hypothetical protein
MELRPRRRPSARRVHRLAAPRSCRRRAPPPARSCRRRVRGRRSRGGRFPSIVTTKRSSRPSRSWSSQRADCTDPSTEIPLVASTPVNAPKSLWKSRLAPEHAPTKRSSRPSPSKSPQAASAAFPIPPSPTCSVTSSKRPSSVLVRSWSRPSRLTAARSMRPSPFASPQEKSAETPRSPSAAPSATPAPAAAAAAIFPSEANGTGDSAARTHGKKHRTGDKERPSAWMEDGTRPSVPHPGTREPNPGRELRIGRAVTGEGFPAPAASRCASPYRRAR